MTTYLMSVDEADGLLWAVKAHLPKGPGELQHESWRRSLVLESTFYELEGHENDQLIFRPVTVENQFWVNVRPSEGIETVIADAIMHYAIQCKKQ